MSETAGRSYFVATEHPWNVHPDDLVLAAMDLYSGLEQGIFENPEDVQAYLDLVSSMTQPPANGMY